MGSSSDSDYKGYTTFENCENEVRLGFVRKVYGVLSVMLFFTFGFVGLVKSSEELNNWMMTPLAWGLSIPAFLGYIVLMCMIMCCTSVARKVPTNYILLGMFTICMTYIVGLIVAVYTAMEVLIAAGMTFAITITLTIYACVTKNDFTSLCGPFACWGLLIICMVSMLCSIASSILFTFTDTFYPFAAGFAVIVYGLYIIIDTQLIMGGGKYQLSVDDYIVGALILYVDIITLFLKLLELVGRR